MTEAVLKDIWDQKLAEVSMRRAGKQVDLLSSQSLPQYELLDFAGACLG